MRTLDALSARWETIRARADAADSGFLLLRAVALAGNYGWLLLSVMPEEDARAIRWIARYFIAYSLVLYVFLFFRFERKQALYRVSLAFDLTYVCLLIAASGGFESSFFLGFYLLAALHSFYYGHPCSLLAAAACAGAYLATVYAVSAPHWIDAAFRASFLFVIALPLGLLSGRLRRDKKSIESLNNELLRSIAELRRLQGKLINEEKLSALGRLTAEVAHEIRNPLTVVGGFARRLEKRVPETAEERKYARIIVSEVARLERILKDVLAFSRDAKLQLRHTNLNETLAEAAELFSALCREKGILVSLEPTPDIPPCIVDDAQIRQAVVNLARNAIDAMPGGGRLSIRTRAERENGVDYVIVDIVDTGAGISSEKMARIFEPFYSTKAMGHGTGLGLSICKKIMEEHGGTVRAKSIPGEGSTFSLYVPYLPAEEAFKDQCWEFVGCGADNGDDARIRCPAYPNYGRICWSVAGTLAETKFRGTCAEKIGDCTKCGFYNSVRAREDLPGTLRGAACRVA